MELPWSHATADLIDLSQARVDLDRDHYGLDNVKKRVLEFLAVRKLKNSLKGVAGELLAAMLSISDNIQDQSCVLWGLLVWGRPVWGALLH